MDCSCTYIPYDKTGYFSSLVTDYLQHSKTLQPFYQYSCNEEGITQAIADREKYPVDRQLLVTTLEKQYQSIDKHGAVTKNIHSLLDENTFTICTAHQPNLLTGYLYFIYKIVHAIKLADYLNGQHPDKHFVPVYYMGSEDNDLDELSVFRYNGKKYRWDGNGQKGAFGRMRTEGLKDLLNELFRVLGPPGDDTEQLKQLLTEAYLKHDNIAAATLYLVNELFGRYGLIVMNPDEAGFKKAMQHVIEDDLLNHTPSEIVTAQATGLAEQYKMQAYPRKINLFYLHDQLRERIEHTGDKWQVLNTGISWTKDELLAELNAHPERFSPNVILRGILQETVLPNVAFIGGGAEVAYWFQLKELFTHYKVFYPVILLRQSVLWIEPAESGKMKQLNINIEELFKTEDSLVEDYIHANSNGHWKTGEEQKVLDELMNGLKVKATSLDPTLKASAEAALAKMQHQLTVLEKKMLRAEKRKKETETNRYTKLKNTLFPNNSLQERTENFIEYYPLHGTGFVEDLYKGIEPLRNEFLVISH